ncbi:thiamine-phosphate synthase [Desulfosarcina alkanivorans]|jgi:thiamine-phosphate pyrophosphorylase|uniref:Thiamine-phosphate synthase n=1 Tax=Desulfosarcina alkanivorans TaxID=571177 RepID=A0A5K7YR52_9BACT|nr:thiamine phosphate synthase [Desulfosarcina alkanivorans]BBO68774.1 thiamine-phosphate synthase [Desulfosarcina alkanivorans]
MKPDEIRDLLRFYFITDDGVADFPVLDQVRLAVGSGATMVQYRNKSFGLDAYEEVEAVCRFCRESGVPFVVNDDVLLAKAVGADGVHVGQDDALPRLARRVMGPPAIIGVSVSTMAELERTDLAFCDYIGTGPTFETGTKVDAKPAHGLAGLRDIVNRSPVPAVAIGGIGPVNAVDCFAHGAAGVAVISCITRSGDPAEAAAAMAAACGVSARGGWS